MQAFFLQIVDAVSYIHRNNIAHRDLKPDNIMITSQHTLTADIKIVDFGVARPSIKPQDCYTLCGTPHYSAPEVIACREDSAGSRRNGYGKKADVWSLGVILYIMLCGAPPFDEEGLYSQIRLGILDFDIPAWSHVSNSAKELVRRLMKVDVGLRLTCDGASHYVHMEWSLRVSGSRSRSRTKDKQHTKVEFV